MHRATVNSREYSYQFQCSFPMFNDTVAKLPKSIRFLISCCVNSLEFLIDNRFRFNYSPVWAYKCESNKCVKVKYNDETDAENMSFAWCRHTCIDPNDINVWPSVQQLQSTESKYIKITDIRFRNNGVKNVRNNFWDDNYERFYRQLNNKMPKSTKRLNGDLDVFVDFNIRSENTNLTMETDENYTLQAAEDNGNVRVTISSETIFGARHALETLVQMIFYDDFSNTLVVSSLK